MSVSASPRTYDPEKDAFESWWIGVCAGGASATSWKKRPMPLGGESATEAIKQIAGVPPGD